MSNIITGADVPPVSYSFFVVVFVGGLLPLPNIFDMRFSKISGLNSQMELHSIEEGGQSLLNQKVPKQLKYDPLKLERGMVLGSPLNIEFNVAMTTMKVAPSIVMVGLLDPQGIPTAAWLCLKAYPIAWKVSDLDADANNVVVDTMEFHYESLVSMRV